MIVTTRFENAYYIAWAGASNPSGVALALHEAITEAKRDGACPRQDAAVTAIAGHLEYLLGRGLGPDVRVFDTLRENSDFQALMARFGE